MRQREISIVLPTGGNDHERVRNLHQCLRCLSRQSVRPVEIIIVEQSLDGEFYHQDIPHVKHIAIQDPENRGYNLAWGRNVGAYAAKGDLVVLMDGDYVFEDNFLQQLSTIHAPFFAGASAYLWSKPVEVSAYLKNYDFNAFRRARPRFVPFYRGKGNGGILCFEREWFHSKFIGFCENFFNYGYEDNEAVNRIKWLLGCSERGFQIGKTPACHLAHVHRVVSPGSNEGLYQKLLRKGAPQVQNELANAQLGKLDSPTLISTS